MAIFEMIVNSRDIFTILSIVQILRVEMKFSLEISKDAPRVTRSPILEIRLKFKRSLFPLKSSPKISHPR